jgi:hypothetical protein
MPVAATFFTSFSPATTGQRATDPVVPRREDETWQIILSFAIVAALLIIMMTVLT